MKIVVAVYNDWGIGQSGTQQIVIPADRKRFLQLTDGGAVIVGRKTFEDFPGPLKNRKNVILTRNGGFRADGAVIVHSVSEALDEVAGVSPDRVFVVGGGDIYRTFLPLCDFAFVTKIKAAPPSDTFFPNLDILPQWRIEMQGDINESNGILYSFSEYKRR